MLDLYNNYATKLKGISSQVAPFPVLNPKLRLVNLTLAQQLNLQPNHISEDSLLSNLFHEKGCYYQNSIAQKYAGHQFGQWNPHLGDGRGLLLAELRDKKGQFWDLHLKGAGPTPYSRHADGRAVLRSTIREYIASEALHAMGIPTSRSLCLISSDEPVIREQMETGAMMIRVCQSHIRFGHFEYLHHSDKINELNDLFEFCFEYHFQQARDSENPHRAILEEIVRSTAILIAKWQAYGFNHGVMNTDNMSVHGITFDYGPYAFLDDYNPEFICNRSDHTGRYAFDQQPGIGLWNLNALAQCFTHYMSIEEITHSLEQYEPIFVKEYQAILRRRLGLSDLAQLNEETRISCDRLVNRWLSILQKERADYHLTFRILADDLISMFERKDVSFSDRFIDRKSVKTWLNDYFALFESSGVTSQKLHLIALDMRRVNPVYVPRNHLLQKAIEHAQQGDFSECERLLAVFSNPFEKKAGFEDCERPPEPNNKAIALSCSS